MKNISAIQKYLYNIQKEKDSHLMPFKPEIMATKIFVTKQVFVEKERGAGRVRDCEPQRDSVVPSQHPRTCDSPVSM